MSAHGVDIVKISGKPLAEPREAAPLWAALAGWAGSCVIVHGGGVQVDAMLGRLGERSERRDGIRLTPDRHMPVVAGVLAGEVNQGLVAHLISAGAPAVGLSLGSFGVLGAEIDPVIGGRVGRVTGGDGSTVRLLLDAGRMPVVSSIAGDGAGGLLNINADDAAAGLARAVVARRVLLLTDVPGVLDADGRTIPELTPTGVERLIARGTITGGMAAKTRAASSLAAATGSEVVVASWRDAAAALDGLKDVGTRIHAAAEGAER